MRKPRRIARWQLRNRLAVVELTLPRQVTPTRAPGDPAQSITVLLLAPAGLKSADMTAGILHLGVGRVLRVTSIAALRRLNHTPTTSDVAIIGSAAWSNSRRLHRDLRRAGWSEVIIRSNGAAAADLLQICLGGRPAFAEIGSGMEKCVPGRSRSGRSNSTDRAGPFAEHLMALVKTRRPQ